MSENNNELLQNVMQQLAEMKAQQSATSATTTPVTGWQQQPQPQAGPQQILGVAIPLKIDTPNGSLKLFVSLPAEVMQSEQSLMSAIEGLVNAGLPVDFWQSKSSGWGGGNGSSYSSGYRSNGGYRNNRRW